ncbi:PHP domain-containing protein [Bacillota bacterium Meth-B3]|nr:PHP domain-containing protein [Christensenellaceae bacterium]MEA5069772.1 PHP domain-containing protein [Christensenellaceae bacterium]
MLLSTPHAHTRYVDGKGTPLEMAEAAIAKGFHSLGLSEHGRQTFDAIYGLSPESERAYIAEVSALKAQLAGRLRLWLGVERDQYGAADRASYDYVIGSKHYIVDGADFFAVDAARETVLAGCMRQFGGDWYALADRYFEEFADFVADYRPDIIGHFDLLVKHNGDGQLFDGDSPRFLDAGFGALERMAATGALLEINTGATARGYRDVIYPSLKFLRRWRELDGRAIVSSDCHDTQHLDAAYDRAYALLRAAGYKTAWALGTGEQRFVEYSI